MVDFAASRAKPGTLFAVGPKTMSNCASSLRWVFRDLNFKLRFAHRGSCFRESQQVRKARFNFGQMRMGMMM
jgi:hypothetical protein